MEAILDLADRLHGFWQRFAANFRTETRDGSQYAYHYLSGLLRMEKDRKFVNIGRQADVPGQNIQHFVSNSPWSAQAVIRQVQEEIAAKPSLQKGGMLLLDESADEKAGDNSAGAARQHNGRLGKVDMSQVGVFLAYANGSVWTWIDGELFIPQHWFEPQMSDKRKRVGIPAERQFDTKIQLGWKMIQRAQASGFPFEAVGCDTLYGRSIWLRQQMDKTGIVYMADVPENTQVYLTRPTVGVPAQSRTKGRKPTRKRVLSSEPSIPVRGVGCREDTLWTRVVVRTTERGELADEFAVRLVWTLREGDPAEEWLVIRRAGDGECSYTLSNAPRDTSVERLAWLRCQRYFVERANQDAKSGLGWDELQAQKYRAWEHHLALTIMATWYIAETKLDWAQQHPRDPLLPGQFDTDVLPALSVANVRTLLRATMPLRQLTPEESVSLVIEHLVNRTRSRKSSLRSQHKANSPP